MYPRYLYRQSEILAGGFESRLVERVEDESALGSGWYSSPADFGIETCPSTYPDPQIAAKKPGANIECVQDPAPQTPGQDPDSQPCSMPIDPQPVTQAAELSPVGPDVASRAKDKPRRSSRPWKSAAQDSGGDST